jgi:hypothetical protein
MHRKGLIVAAMVASIGLAAASAVNATPLTATNSTYAQLDASSTTRPLDITGFGTISDVNITIQFAKCDDPAFGSPGPCIGQGFSFDREIQFRLTNPSNTTTVDLVLQDTFSGRTPGSGTQTLTFDDSAATIVGGGWILSGTYRPVGSLAAFNGQEAHGVWTLFLEDTVGADPLMYFSSELVINQDGAAVPDPGSSLLLLGMGLVSLGAWRKRLH